MDYLITPVTVEGHADADGVYENSAGAWLGEVDWRTNADGDDEQYVAVYSEDGDYIPAPENWRDLVIKPL
jgi:hypothetical protein